MDSFWEILRRDGLREPILMRVCARTGHGRLETGNHRCWLAERNGVASRPCIVEIAEGPINKLQNGDHVFDLRPELIGFAPRRQPYPVMTAPRHIFRIAAPARSQASAAE